MPRISFIGSSILFVCLAGCLWTLIANGADKKTNEKQTLDDKAVLTLVEARANDLVRVTEKPVPMKPNVGTLCMNPRVVDQIMEARKDDPHRRYDLHVYVPKESERIIRSGKGSYPVGTLIVKEKLPAHKNNPLDITNDNSGNRSKASATKEPDAKPALFTAMLKREKDYNPNCGDWEFITISGDAKQVTSRGKTETCIGCHKKYKETDFITRTYIEEEAKPPIDFKSLQKK